MHYRRATHTGFSTLELMIAFALISIVLVGAVGANFAAQYWAITSQTANEALYKAKTKLEDLRALTKEDFYQATSSPFTRSMQVGDPADQSCIDGGLCYFLQTTITDLSSCSKYVQAQVFWKSGHYPTTTTSLFTNLTNSPETVAMGGDCLLNQPEGDWSAAPSLAGVANFAPGKQFTAVDVLHKKIYVAAAASPHLQIYDAPSAANQNPTPRGSLTVTVGGVARAFNSIDAADDLSTGRTYVYGALHATTSQLVVIDATDWNNPTLVAKKTLLNVDGYGSFPQGWRVLVYGSRLYITTRETATNELHIFDIATPTLPTEIGTGYQLGRTVNAMIARDQKIAGTTHRLLFLAASSDLKEVTILDVTGDTVSEIASVDLPGGYDAKSIMLLGNTLYVGRESNPTDRELYAFDITVPSAIASRIIGQAEVGADVTSLHGSGAYLFVGTSKAGQELQVWDTVLSTWTGALNAGRLTSTTLSGLAPLGVDVDTNFLYAVSQTAAADSLKVFYQSPFTP